MAMDEDSLLPLSGLAQLIYCERRAALIHIEGLWSENAYTVEGSYLHRWADTVGVETRPGVRIARATPLRSLRLGLSGKADVIEFRSTPRGEIAYPLDYKRGRLPKWQQPCWEVQLCAQGICLEEMLGVSVPAGAIYFGGSHRRQEVVFTPELRRRTEEASARFHALVASGRTPLALPDRRCEPCSMREHCMPTASREGRSAAAWFRRALASGSTREDPP
jgi:CRISPR-associated exonuclease Cas4